MQESTPLVSIVCDVYNHEDYLHDCLNSLVSQKTNFKYIILIHDDASTDSSSKIVREYVKKFPRLFDPIFQNENQYSKGVGIWKTIQFPRVKTKYVAFCEGDDYWIDSYKLQKQVDFLESHNDYSGVFGNIIVRNEKNNNISEDKSAKESRNYTSTDVLKGTIFPLASVCVRKDVITNWDMNINANGDFILSYTATKLGKVYMLEDYVSVYRMTGKGVSSSRGPRAYLIAEFSEWYNFHKQIGFQQPPTLIYHQSEILFRYCLNYNIKDVPFKEISHFIRPLYLPYYIYYILSFSLTHFFTSFYTKFIRRK